MHIHSHPIFIVYMTFSIYSSIDVLPGHLDVYTCLCVCAHVCYMKENSFCYVQPFHAWPTFYSCLPKYEEKDSLVKFLMISITHQTIWQIIEEKNEMTVRNLSLSIVGGANNWFTDRFIFNFTFYIIKLHRKWDWLEKHDEHISVNIKHFISDKMKVLGFNAMKVWVFIRTSDLYFSSNVGKHFFNKTFKKKYGVHLFFKSSSRYFYLTDNENFSLFHVVLVDETQISVQDDQNGDSVCSPKVTLVKQNNVSKYSLSGE